MSNSNTGRNATVKTLLETNKAIRKIKQEQVEIKYFGLGYPSRIKVVVYVNGSQGSLSSNYQRLTIDTACLQEMREMKEITKVWVPGCEQLADVLQRKQPIQTS